MSPGSPLNTANKKLLITAYILGSVHLLLGIFKLIGQADLTKEFTEVWHFPLWFMYFIGIAQVLGGVGLFIRELRLPASLGMAYIMFGAIGTTIISRQYISISIYFAILLLCIIVFIHSMEELTEQIINEHNEKNHELEFVGITTFKLKTGISNLHFLEVEKKTQEVIKIQKGFIAREIGSFEDGHWIVTTRWTSKEYGTKWAENSQQYEIIQKQNQMLDFSTMRIEFYQTY